MGTASKTISFLIIILLVMYIGLIAHQVSRYKPHVYDCSDMSEDLEIFFEGLGFDTWLIIGERYNDSNHMWIMVDTGIIPIEIESTCLAPFSPRIIHDYDDLHISKGYIVSGVQIENANFNDW